MSAWLHSLLEQIEKRLKGKERWGRALARREQPPLSQGKHDW